MSLTRVVISLLIIFIVAQISKWISKRRRLVSLIEKLPGPPTIPYVPFMGHTIVTLYVDSLNYKQDTYAILYSMINSLNALYADEGIARFWLGLKPLVLLFSPETAESVLTSTTVINKANEYSVFEPWIGEGLITSGRAKWRFRRKILTPAFHFRILKDFLPIMNTEVTKLLRKLNQPKYLDDNAKPIDIVPLITLCTLDTICETAMGININCQDDEHSEYVLALHELSEMALCRVVRPWLRPDFLYYRSEYGKRFLKARNIMHNFTKKVILERKAEWLNHQASVDANGEKTNSTIVEQVGNVYKSMINQQTTTATTTTQAEDNKIMEDIKNSSFFTKGNKRLAFLDLLLHQHLTAKTMNLADVQEEVDTFMFAGHDTTAMGISWTLYLLGLHEDIQQKCYEELESIFKDDEYEYFDDDQRPAAKLIVTNVENEQISEMRYLDRVIKEVLRLYPPVPFVAREVTEDIMIAGKHLIPEGTTCVVFTHCLHLNPKVYPKPEIFDPDRFLPENAPKSIFAYIPFSAGPRNCIGQKFAQREQKIIIAKILRNYKIKTIDQRDKLTIVGELVLRSRDGLHVKLIPRFPRQSTNKAESSSS